VDYTQSLLRAVFAKGALRLAFKRHVKQVDGNATISFTCPGLCSRGFSLVELIAIFVVRQIRLYEYYHLRLPLPQPVVKHSALLSDII